MEPTCGGNPPDRFAGWESDRTHRVPLRARHGYVEITPKLRAKVFGLNALKIYPIEPEVVKRHVRQDKVARRREDYRERPDPAFVTYGPKSPAQYGALPNRGGQPRNGQRVRCG